MITTTTALTTAKIVATTTNPEETVTASSETTHASTNQNQQCYEIKNWIAIATASSVYWSEEDYGANLAIDGLIYEEWWGFFHSDHDIYAWLQLDFSTPVTIESLSVVMRYDCCADYRFKNIGVYVGNEPAIYGVVSRNQKCMYYEGPAQNGATVEMVCNAPVTGQFLVIQIVEWNYEALMVNEVTVCGYEGKFNSCNYGPLSELVFHYSLTALGDVNVPGPLQPDEWISFEHQGIQAWFSQEAMTHDQAVSHCTTMGSHLFEPYNHDLFEVISDAARRAGLTFVWLGLTDVDEEGV